MDILSDGYSKSKQEYRSRSNSTRSFSEYVQWYTKPHPVPLVCEVGVCAHHKQCKHCKDDYCCENYKICPSC
jgi:hypothetical protein